MLATPWPTDMQKWGGWWEQQRGAEDAVVGGRLDDYEPLPPAEHAGFVARAAALEQAAQVEREAKAAAILARCDAILKGIKTE